MIKLQFLVFILIALCPCHTLAEQLTPCLEMRNGRWRILKDSQCAQLTQKDVVSRNNRLKKLKYYVKKYEPDCERTKKKYRSLDEDAKRRLAIWQEQRRSYLQLNDIYKSQSDVWQKAFIRVRNQKVPPRHWTESPILWVSVGLVTGVATTIAITYALRLK